MPGIRVTSRYIAVTDIGRQREHNEDAVGEPRAFVSSIAARGWLFAVADRVFDKSDLHSLLAE